MKRSQAWFIASILTLLLAGCGSKDGEPLPPTKTTMDFSDGRGWQAALKWGQTLRFSDDEFLEMFGTIDFRDKDGQIPKSLEAVSLRADMPQHGHGTGNNVPEVGPVSDVAARYWVKNLYFTMTGSWRIQITATINGVVDVWSSTVDVGD
jgi:hypothetical protein